jgi:hypothetical protein
MKLLSPLLDTLLAMLLAGLLCCACSSDDDPVADVLVPGSTWQATTVEAWRGSFGTTALEYKGIPAEDKGPVFDAQTQTLTWRNVVYGDCTPPGHFLVSLDDLGGLVLMLEPGENLSCGEDDVIGDASAVVPLPSGSYGITVGTSLKARNVGAQNLPPRVVDVVVP